MGMHVLQCAFTHVYMYMVSLSSLFSERCPLFVVVVVLKQGLLVAWMSHIPLRWLAGDPGILLSVPPQLWYKTYMAFFCVSSGILTQAFLLATREAVSCGTFCSVSKAGLLETAGSPSFLHSLGFWAHHVSLAKSTLQSSLV